MSSDMIAAGRAGRPRPDPGRPPREPGRSSFAPPASLGTTYLGRISQRPARALPPGRLGGLINEISAEFRHFAELREILARLAADLSGKGFGEAAVRSALEHQMPVFETMERKVRAQEKDGREELAGLLSDCARGAETHCLIHDALSRVRNSGCLAADVSCGRIGEFRLRDPDPHGGHATDREFAAAAESYMQGDVDEMAGCLASIPGALEFVSRLASSARPHGKEAGTGRRDCEGRPDDGRFGPRPPGKAPPDRPPAREAPSDEETAASDRSPGPSAGDRSASTDETTATQSASDTDPEPDAGDGSAAPADGVKLAQVRHRRAELEQLELLVAEAGKLPGPIRKELFADLSRRIGRTGRPTGRDGSRGSFPRAPGGGVAEELASAGLSFDDVVRSARQAIDANPPRPGTEASSVAFFRLRVRLLGELSGAMTRLLDERGEAGPAAAEEVRLAARDAAFGRGLAFRAFRDARGIGDDLARGAALRAVSGMEMFESPRPWRDAPPRAPQAADYAARRGGCAKYGGVALMMARHGLVKGIASGIAATVKESIAATVLVALDKGGGMDFWTAGFFGSSFGLLFSTLGYDELEDLVSDVLNGLFVGRKFEENREQATRWRLLGHVLNYTLAGMMFTPAAQGIMGATGVSSEDDLALYVLTKLVAQSAGNFGVGAMRAAVRLVMPETFHVRWKERREPLVWRSARRSIESQLDRFRGERRFREIAGVVARLAVNLATNTAISLAWHLYLDPEEESAPGFDSHAFDRWAQSFAYYLISGVLMLLVIFGGRFAWNAIDRQREAAFEDDDSSSDTEGFDEDDFDRTSFGEMESDGEASDSVAVLRARFMDALEGPLFWPGIDDSPMSDGEELTRSEYEEADDSDIA